MKNKRGEITTQHIVILIVLIASFAIILFFLMRLGLGDMTEKEICHNSVVARGSSVLPEESIPLNCHREYVCITEDGTCEAMTKPKKEKVNTKDEVYEVLANEMADCWWMFGEGGVNYVGSDFKEKLYCSICSQIAFDDSMQDIFSEGVISEEEFYIYMKNNNVSGQDYSYLEYLYAIDDMQTVRNILSEQGVNFGEINLNQEYYAMMGVISEKSTFKRVLLGAGVGVVVVAGALLTPITGGASLVSTAGILFTTGGAVAGGSIMGFTGEGPTGEKFLKPMLIEVNSDEFRDLDCKSIETLA